MKISWNKKQIYIIIGILLAIGFLYFLCFFLSFYIKGLFQTVLILSSGCIALFLLSKCSRRLNNFIRGIGGERKVEGVLSRDLPMGYKCLPDVRLGDKGNIDFILVGPTGVWSIEVKSHSGLIDFNGKELRRGGELFEKDFLKQAWAEAYSVRDFLKLKINQDYFVQPVIVFSSPYAKMKFGFKKVDGVYVVNLRLLIDLILGRKGTFEVNEIDKIFNVIKGSIQ